MLVHDDNPTLRVPWVTIALIGVCAGIMIWELTQPDLRFALWTWGFKPAIFLGGSLPQDVPAAVAEVPQAATLLTSMFLHGSLGHLVGNMLFLWTFGDNVEDSMIGPVTYLVFYMLCGVAASAVHAVVDLGNPIPAVGASGAISGLMGAYLVIFPHAPLKLSWWILRLRWLTITVPAWLAIGLWFALQLVMAWKTPTAGIAWFAHIGGFVAGVLLVMAFRIVGLAMEPIDYPRHNDPDQDLVKFR